MTIEREDWGPRPDGPRETPGFVAPAQPAEVAPEEPARNMAPAPVDDEVLDLARHTVERGIFSLEEAQRHYGLTEEEAAALLVPKPEPKQPVTRASVGRELAEIERARRNDRASYMKDDKLQARERELIALREKLPDDLQPGDGSSLDSALVEEWERTGGVEHNLAAVQGVAKTVLEQMDDCDRTAFIEGFDSLPITAQNEVYRHLAVSPARSRAASAEAVAELAAVDPGLIEDWGRRAPEMLGRAQSRVGSILGTMSEGDKQAALDWFDGLSKRQAAAVLKALAR